MRQYQRHTADLAALLAGLCLLGLAGCTTTKPPPANTAPPAKTAQAAGPVPVLVTADLQPLFDEARAEFARQHPDVQLQVTVKPGAELRAAAAAAKLDGLLVTLGPPELVPIDQASRLAVGSRVLLARVPLTVVVAPGNPLGICTVADVAGPKVKALALGDEASGSVGKEAEQALRTAKLWDKAKAKVRRVPLEALIGEVAEGRAQAAIVGVHQVADQVAVACPVGEDLHAEVQLLAVRTTGLQVTPQVTALTEYLGSAAARRPLLAKGLLEPQTEQAKGQSLFLYCAAGLREAAETLIAAFKAETGIEVQPTYTGSGCLLAQITISQTGDLYFPGEDWYMAQAKERGYVADSATVAYFVPVIMVQRGNPKGIKGLADLMRPDVRVGIGEPKSCAIGQFTQKVIEANGMSFEALDRKAVSHFVTAPELGNAVKLGAVDACVQWDAVASWYLDDADVVAFPTNAQTISPIPLGVLNFSKHPQEARRFMEFVRGPKGQAILAEHGHTLDPAHPRFPPAGAPSA